MLRRVGRKLRCINTLRECNESYGELDTAQIATHDLASVRLYC